MQTVECIEVNDAMGISVRELRPAEFAARTGENPPNPCVLVIRASQGSELAASCDTIDDRGSKHKAKGLNSYFSNRAMTSLVRADYDSAGRCLQSIETLLRNSADAAGWRLFVLVVSDAIFGELLAEAADASYRETGGLKAMPGGFPDPNELILNQLGRVPADHPSRRKLIGVSEKIELARALCDRAAHCELPVLILGDSGTGKEIAARLIHSCGDRAQSGRFLAVNCAAIPDELLENELFGSVPGAYTSARDKKGLWEMAEDGTLFLDEIGDLSLRHQAKVLRTLEEGVIRRVGADKDIRVNARVIAATHRDIEGNVSNADFRKDLYYRLYGIRVLLPSLDECPQDISRLAAHFWREITGNKTARLAHAFCSQLESMSWPGNGRQLKATLSRLRHLFDTEEPSVEQLQLLVMHERSSHTGNRPSTAVNGLPQVDALAHLRRTAAALHAVELLLKHLQHVAGQGNGQAALDDLQLAGLHTASSELQSLTADPVLFGSEDLFRQVAQIVEQLGNINGILGPVPDDQENHVRSQIHSTLSSVFQKVEELTGQLGHTVSV